MAGEIAVPSATTGGNGPTARSFAPDARAVKHETRVAPARSVAVASAMRIAEMLPSRRAENSKFAHFESLVAPAGG